MSDTVYATTMNGWRHIYHTDRECQYLQRAEHRIQERDPDKLGEQWSACKHCDGSAGTGQSEPGWGHYRDLVAAAGGGD